MPIESAVLSNNCSANNPLNKFFGKLADLTYGQTPSWRFPGNFTKFTEHLFCNHRGVFREPTQISKMKLFANKSNQWRCSFKKGVLKNFAKFTRKHLYQCLFFNKVAGFGLQLHLKRDSSTGVFL